MPTSKAVDRSKSKGWFRVVDKARGHLGATMVEETEIKDRGNIGYEGGRLYRVSFPMTLTDPIETDVPAGNLQVA